MIRTNLLFRSTLLALLVTFSSQSIALSKRPFAKAKTPAVKEAGDKESGTKKEEGSNAEKPPEEDDWQKLLESAKHSYNEGKREQAANTLDLALAASERLRATARTEAYCQIADLSIRLELFDKAQGLLEEAIKIKLPLKDKLLQANAMDNLANVYTKKGNYEEAEKLQKDAEKIYQSTMKKEGNPDYAIFLANCAQTARAQKRYAEAKKLLHESLIQHEKAEGQNSLSAAEIYINLAGLYCDQNDLTRASQALQYAENIIKPKLPANHPLAKLCLKSQRVLQKKKIDQLLKADSNPYKPEIAQEVLILAGQYKREGNFAQSAEAYKQALGIQEQILTPGDPKILPVIEEYADCLHQLGDTAGASQLEQKAQSLKNSSTN